MTERKFSVGHWAWSMAHGNENIWRRYDQGVCPEQEAWQSRMMQKADFLPEASPVCLVFVEGEEGHVVVPEGLRED